MKTFCPSFAGTCAVTATKTTTNFTKELFELRQNMEEVVAVMKEGFHQNNIQMVSLREDIGKLEYRLESHMQTNLKQLVGPISVYWSDSKLLKPEEDAAENHVEVIDYSAYPF